MALPAIDTQHYVITVKSNPNLILLWPVWVIKTQSYDGIPTRLKWLCGSYCSAVHSYATIRLHPILHNHHTSPSAQAAWFVVYNKGLFGQC